MCVFLFLIFFLNLGNIEAIQSTDSILFPERSETEKSTHLEPLFHKIFEEALYLAGGKVFSFASFLSRLGGEISLITSKDSITQREYLLFSELCDFVSQKAFAQMGRIPFSKDGLSFPFSQYSWRLNEEELSQIPAFSEDQEKLLLFLKRRWLAKSTGFVPSIIDWVCPVFGLTVQVHPETDGSYARSPAIQFSSSYKKRVQEWKKHLPHPDYFPLILTRPCHLEDYLPSYCKIAKEDNFSVVLEKIASKTGSTKLIVDLTEVVKNNTNNPKKWIKDWKVYRSLLKKQCKEHGIDPLQILCIQKLEKEEIGAIRLLPLFSSSTEEIEQDHKVLIEWISTFGLSANRVELDRCLFPLFPPISESSNPSPDLLFGSKERFLSYLSSFDLNQTLESSDKILMVKGCIAILKGLISSVSEDSWNEIVRCQTRSAILKLSFDRIQKQLQLLERDQKTMSFFSLTAQLELIYASFTPLLEIISPFTFDDFSTIYRKALSCIPSNLKSLTSCAIHSSGMTSVAGILKSVEKSLGNSPHILYGENIYYECVNAAKKVGKTVSLEEAQEEDFQKTDLFLAQFNPALKRIDLPPTTYKIENIAETLHRILSPDRKKPLVLALDCTFDFINSSQLTRLLSEFQQEIEKGILNVICYRSGLKFDLFGMDNYCGAPFFMIHNQDSKWTAFDFVLVDKALQTDRLSLNWFCLAYQHAIPELELYRNQIFQNTRALLNKVPSRLVSNQSLNYRIIPVEAGVDPAFIDIKISGAFHQLRAAALVAGTLYLTCMEGGQPIFHRITVGLYHPNFTMIFGEENSTIRLTLGLDPAQVDLLAQCFTRIDQLNDR